MALEAAQLEGPPLRDRVAEEPGALGLVVFVAARTGVGAAVSATATRTNARIRTSAGIRTALNAV